MAATVEKIVSPPSTVDEDNKWPSVNNKTSRHPSLASVYNARLLREKAVLRAGQNGGEVTCWVLFISLDKNTNTEAEGDDKEKSEAEKPPKLLYWRFKKHTLTMHESETETEHAISTISIDKILVIDIVKQLNNPSRDSPISTDSSSSSLEETINNNNTRNDPHYPVLFEGSLEHIFTMRTSTESFYCGTSRRAKASEKTACFEFALAMIKHAGHSKNILCSCGCHKNPHYIREFYEMHDANVLGSGEFGRVCTAVFRKNGRKVAVKIVDTITNQVKTHTRTPKGIDHPCVVELLDFYFTPDHIYCVMELIDRNLFDLLLSLPHNHFDERRTKFVIQQILAGLEYLHSTSIVHGDLKPENVLVVDDHPFPQVKISDFGYLRIIKERAFQRAVIDGSREYIPPEAFTSEPRFDKAFDMWSVGVITYICLSGVFPYNPAENITDQIRQYSALFPREIWCNISQQAPSFITHLLNEAVWFRTRSIPQALRHDWLSQDYTSWCDLRVLEVRVGTASESGTVMRYATQEEDDRRWEHASLVDKLPPWEEIGCKL